MSKELELQIKHILESGIHSDFPFVVSIQGLVYLEVAMLIRDEQAIILHVYPHADYLAVQECHFSSEIPSGETMKICFPVLIRKLESLAKQLSIKAILFYQGMDVFILSNYGHSLNQIARDTISPLGYSFLHSDSVKDKVPSFTGYGSSLPYYVKELKSDDCDE